MLHHPHIVWSSYKAHHFRQVFPYSCTHFPRVWWCFEGRGSVMRRRSKAWYGIKVAWNIEDNFQCFLFFSRWTWWKAQAAWRLKSLDKCRPWALFLPGENSALAFNKQHSNPLCFKQDNILSTHSCFLKREISERWNRGSSVQRR